MEKDRNLEELVLRGEMSITEFACAKIDDSIERMTEKHPELLWTMGTQKFVWDNCRDAQKNGKKLLFFEMTWSF